MPCKIDYHTVPHLEALTRCIEDAKWHGCAALLHWKKKIWNVLILLHKQVKQLFHLTLFVHVGDLPSAHNPQVFLHFFPLQYICTSKAYFSLRTRHNKHKNVQLWHQFKPLRSWAVLKEGKHEIHDVVLCKNWSCIMYIG